MTDPLSANPSLSSTVDPGRGKSPSPRAWLAVCALLLGVTWLPLLGVHAQRMSQADAAAGTVIAVFAPTLPARAPFERVAAAGGAMVRPVAGWRHAWIVRSPEPGFAGRLRAQGAWGVFAPELLSARAFLDCFRPAPPG